MRIGCFLYATLAGVMVVVVSGALTGCAGAHRRSAQPVSVPASALEGAAESPEPSSERSGVAGVIHVVQPGQTLWRIARAYSVSLEELAAANGITDPTRIDAGTALFVPGAREVLEIPPYPALPEGGPTAPRRESTTASGWIWPVPDGAILSYFGAPRNGHRHAGIDVAGVHGTDVLAVGDGRVVYSGTGMRGYGKTVMIDHGDGLVTLYAHNSELLVRRGERVRQGEPIARLGRTGNATSDHCHFEVRREDVQVDPLMYLLPPLEAKR